MFQESDGSGEAMIQWCQLVVRMRGSVWQEDALRLKETEAVLYFSDIITLALQGRDFAW